MAPFADCVPIVVLVILYLITAVLTELMSNNAAAVILVHNHPSGDPEPSEADRRITEHLKEALGLMDIRVKTAEACRRAFLGLPLRNVVG